MELRDTISKNRDRVIAMLNKKAAPLSEAAFAFKR
jgi:hypothetical protein